MRPHDAEARHARVRTIALSALVMVMIAAPAGSRQFGYMPPGTDASGGVEDMVLIYHGREVRPDYNRENLLPYVAYLDADGEPQDWLFDSFLFLEFATDDGTWIHHYREGSRLPTIDDWIWLADAWFRPETGLIGLEQAMDEVAGKLGPAERKAKVVITLPQPIAQDEAFGPLPGEDRTLDLGDPDDAHRAIAWYIGRVLDQWRAADYQHLELLGFYWTAESISGQYMPHARWTSEYLHQRGLRHYWIPYFGATGYSNWREAGFDCVMLQPNYFFTDETRPLDWFRNHALQVTRANTGVEVEFDGRALTDEEYRRRMIAYFDAGVAYGWMNGAVLGYYEGGGAVGQFYRAGAEGRDLYRALYEFVRGTYEPSGENDFPPLEIPERGENAEDLALASRGAVVHGAIQEANWGDGITPEKMIDGDIFDYGGMYGFTAFYIPGSVTVELPEVATISRINLMLFDLDNRFFRYRLDTSVDRATWTEAVDCSEGEWRGWQTHSFEPREAKYIRFTCLHNSANNICQVVELEAYSD